VAARSPCSTTPRRDSYERRRPDETLLYRLIEEHWPTFLERAEQSGGLPDFIVEEFEASSEVDATPGGLFQHSPWGSTSPFHKNCRIRVEWPTFPCPALAGEP
jgi:hypothetical protein